MALDIVEDVDLPRFGWQPPQRGVERYPLERNRRGGRLQTQVWSHVANQFFPRPQSAVGSHAVEYDIDGETPHPSAGIGALTQPIEVPPDANEHILRQFRRAGGVPAHSVTQPVNPIRVLLVDAGEARGSRFMRGVFGHERTTPLAGFALECPTRWRVPARSLTSVFKQIR